MHDLAPGRSASAVGRRCGCARARYAAVQSSVAQLTAACAGPALGGGPARRQPDQTQAADSMALTWRRTVKDSGTRPRLSPMFCAGAERSLTVQPPWNGQSVTIPVSGVAGLSGSPQLLSRYRRCSLVTFCLSGCFSWLPDVVVTHPRRAASTDPGHRGCGAAEWVHASYRGRAGSERPPSVSDGDCVERRTRPDRPGAVPG